jgi:hypothetical protein
MTVAHGLLPHNEAMNAPTAWLDQIAWDDKGLVPVIAQEQSTGDVLMFAWMNREALAKTAETGRAVYYSRSRGKLWFKAKSRVTCKPCTKSAWIATTMWCCSRSRSSVTNPASLATRGVTVVSSACTRMDNGKSPSLCSKTLSRFTNKP